MKRGAPKALRTGVGLLPVVGLCLLTRPLQAQEPWWSERDSARVQTIDSVTVTGRPDDLIGIAASASEGRIGAADLRHRPVAREGELLETVPGFIVAQHSGDGKANQYFVRGFNLDHGTDFQTRLEGMPLNLPSHAHGQGYTDLNLLIPELVDQLDYRLGVHHAELGDFGSAGGADIHLVSRLSRPFAAVDGGEGGFARVVAGGSHEVARGDLLVAGEVKLYDGPWDLAQRTRKFNGLARYTRDVGSSRLSVLGMAYHNRWNATDQIPLRAVRSGIISRFGFIDPTDGGTTRRYSLSGSWRRAGARSVQAVQLFGVYSDLSLFSNFGYFLDDPERGDQFNQEEQRIILGANVRHTQEVQALGASHLVKGGFQTRADFLAPVGLYRSRGRIRIGTVREDQVREWGGGLYAEAESRWAPWFRSVLGLRGDLYTFSVSGDIPENAGHRTAAMASPKASLVFAPSTAAEVYLSGGLGFHSNDARGTTITVDPVSGEPAEQVDPLVRSRGGELGLRATPVSGWRSTLAVWALDLDSELLFVGDGGATEPSFASRRRGITWANFYRPIPELSLDVDLSFARARFAAVPAGEDRIPGALETVLAAGATWSSADGGPFGALRLRHFGSYPLIEDNSVRATATTLLNAEAGYLFPNRVRLRVSVLNLANARHNDIQYYYTSRLPGEPAEGVDDVHFHPVEPRQVRVGLSWGL
jgi:hypothetical protein